VQRRLLVSTQTTRFLTCLLILGNAGCAAHDRRVAGETVAATGALVALTGLVIAAGCLPLEDEDDPTAHQCDEQSPEPKPQVGLPVTGVGLGIALVGGIIYGTAVPAPVPSPPQRPPAKSARPHGY
jgi:hypothetical protein